MKFQQKLTEYTSPRILLILLTFILVGFGWIMVYSSSAMKAPYERKIITIKKSPEYKDEIWKDNEYHNSYYLKKQIIFTILGFIGLLLLYKKISYDELKKYAPAIMAVSVFLLLLVFVPFLGVKLKGASRWIKLGFMRFQPSEFAKLATIIFMASFLADNKRKITDLKKGLLPIGFFAAIPLALVYKEPDLGATVIIGAVIMGMCLISRIKKTHLFAIMGIGVLVFALSIVFNPWRLVRIKENDQVIQSLIAVGSGGVYGYGLGNGISKYHFLQEAHCDFIFSIICQELGFIGAVVLVTLYLFWIIQGIRIAWNASTDFEVLLASGITMMIGLPAFVNIFSALRLGPTKGLVLPFISYGGSSILISLIGTGILLSIARNREVMDRDARMRIGRKTA